MSQPATAPAADVENQHHNAHNNEGHHAPASDVDSRNSPYGEDKEEKEELETIHTNERVGSHINYYEKGGLRTEGDGIDHIGVHHKMNPKLFLNLVALAFMWVGSQIPLYLFGGITVDIYSDIGGVDRWIWIIVGYLVALAAVCPFTGALSDLVGRRYAALIGSALIIIGMIVCSTASNMNNFIAGMTLAGAGAGINELIALAGTGELVPTSKRGLYVGLMVFTITPFCPSILYAQLIQQASNWRYVGLLCGVWNAVAFLLTVLFYWPPPRLNSEGYSAAKILSRVDWIGGFLSIVGVLLFLMGLQFGSQQYQWGDAHVIAPFVIGIVLMVAFVFWELYGAKYPMVPGRLFLNGRVLTLTLLVTFFSGANFIALLFFWPTEAYNVYGNDPLGIGIRGLPIGFGIIGGAVISLVLIGITKGRIRGTMMFFTALMTAGTGAMAIGTPKNLNSMYGVLTIASVGVGGVIVPCSIIATIVCPDDLIATITALTLSIRVLGGAIGFTIYYNIFYKKFVGYATQIVGVEALAFQLLQFNVTLDTELVTLAGNAEYGKVAAITDTWEHTPGAYNIIMEATQWAFSQAYAWPYYISIAFGAVTFLCAAGLGNIRRFLDDHIAVVV